MVNVATFARDDFRLVEVDPLPKGGLAVVIKNELPLIAVEVDRSRNAIDEKHFTNRHGSIPRIQAVGYHLIGNPTTDIEFRLVSCSDGSFPRQRSI
jgi:hypothetical protein